VELITMLFLLLWDNKITQMTDGNRMSPAATSTLTLEFRGEIQRCKSPCQERSACAPRRNHTLSGRNSSVWAT